MFIGLPKQVQDYKSTLSDLLKSVTSIFSVDEYILQKNSYIQIFVERHKKVISDYEKIIKKRQRID